MQLTPEQKRDLKFRLNDDAGNEQSVYHMVRGLLPYEVLFPGSNASFERGANSVGESDPLDLDLNANRKISERAYERLLKVIDGLFGLSQDENQGIAPRSVILFEKKLIKARETLIDMIADQSGDMANQARHMKAAPSRRAVEKILDVGRKAQLPMNDEDVIERQELSNRANQSEQLELAFNKANACRKMLGAFDAALAMFREHRKSFPPESDAAEISR